LKLLGEELLDLKPPTYHPRFAEAGNGRDSTLTRAISREILRFFFAVNDSKAGEH
jgi:hypothetical protein